MSCPHSTREGASPDRCSLCLVPVVERIPVLDEDAAIAAVKVSLRRRQPRVSPVASGSRN